MDTSGKFNHHSKLKLTVLKTYLPSLISVVQGFAKEVEVIDAFCGKGGDDEGNEGSAKIILDTLSGMSFTYKHVKFRASFNDLDPANIEKIKQLYNSKYSKSKIEFATSCSDGEHFIKNWKNSLDKFTFLFYDPFNYSPIKKSIFKDFISRNYAEALIFIPFSFVYRFIDEVKEGRHKDNPNHVLKIFLEETFGDEYLKLTKNENEVLKALETQFSMGLFYSNSLMIQEGANKYALIFISKKSKGSQYFLEACYRNISGGLRLKPDYDVDSKILKLVIKNASTSEGQISFLDNVETDDDFRIENENFFNDLKGGSRTNVELYEYLLSRNVLPSHISKLLNKLIKENKVQLLDESGLPAKGLHLKYKPEKKRTFKFQGL